MEPNNDATKAAPSATDAFFAAEAAKADAQPEESEALSPESPIGDYTRELQQEYDEQQDVGKLYPCRVTTSSPATRCGRGPGRPRPPSLSCQRGCQAGTARRGRRRGRPTPSAGTTWPASASPLAPGSGC